MIPQGPTKATLDFIDRIGPLTGKTAGVFTTYDLAIGRTLKKMAAPLAAKGANVTGEFKSRGPQAAREFAAWVNTL